MLKAIGAFLIVCSAASAGFSAAGHLGRRVQGLQSFLVSLELMERELSFRLTTVPDLLALLAEQAEMPARAFFRSCLDGLDGLGERRLSQIWRSSLKSCPMELKSEDLNIIGELGEILGCYDDQSQRAALEASCARLACNLAQAREEHQRIGKVYSTLGIAIGSFLVIVFL